MSSSSKLRHEYFNMHLSMISKTLEFDVIEVWIRKQNKLHLYHSFVEPNFMKSFNNEVTHYHAKESTLQKSLSIRLCDKAFESADGFKWYCREETNEKSFISNFPVFTACCFYVPRDNVNTDIFLCYYSKKRQMYRQSRGDYLNWSSLAAITVAFSSSLLNISNSDSNKR